MQKTFQNASKFSMIGTAMHASAKSATESNPAALVALLSGVDVDLEIVAVAEVDSSAAWALTGDALESRIKNPLSSYFFPESFGIWTGNPWPS